MDKYLKKFSEVANYGHCIIKEELMISDSDEEIDVEKLDDQIDSIPTNASISDSQAEIEFDKPKKSKETSLLTNRKSERLRNKNVSDDKKNQTTLNLFIKSENIESDNEQSENSTDSIIKKKPKAGIKTTEYQIDALAKKVAKSYCKKCEKERAVIRHKARCSKCKTQLSYVCHTCNRTYRSFTDLGYHLKCKHIEVPVVHPCTICCKTFAYRKGLMDHRRIHRIRRSLQCSKCGKEFNGSNHKTQHENVCGEQANYKCEKCSYAAWHKSNLTKHILEMHSGFKAKCDNCPKVFTNPRSFKRHVNHYCNKAKRLECHHCGHMFYRKDQLIVHLNQNHMSGYYTNSNSDKKLRDRKTCPDCGLTLAHHARMEHHMIRCKLGLSTIVPFAKKSRICKYCGETMKRFEHMRYHVERCDSAPLAFRYSAERAKLPDMNTALTELAISHCVECKIKKPLKHPVRRCSKCNMPLKFACVSCAKSFVDLDQLRKHFLKHVRTLKFYHCDKCNCSYKRKDSLIVHQRDVHSNKQRTTNYKCKKCGKEYKNKASLRKHMISCSEEPKFYCDKCPYKTHFKGSMIYHIWAKGSTCIQ